MSVSAAQLGTPRLTYVSSVGPERADATEPSARRRWLLDDRTVGISALVLGGFTLAALLAPIVAPYDPTVGDTAQGLRPGFWAGDLSHPLGTDLQGRDLLSRVLHGGRASLTISLAAVLLSLLIGVPAGLIAGYYRGAADDALMRLAEIQLAFPPIMLALALVALVGPGAQNVVLILGIAGWVVYARVIRGRVLSLRSRDFVEAARAIGAPDRVILTRHVLRNSLSPILVLATLELAGVLIAESTLSFLGVGVQPPTPTWGGMLADGKLYLRNAWWIATVPGVAITLVVVCINLLGDRARDLLDPMFVGRGAPPRSWQRELRSQSRTVGARRAQIVRLRRTSRPR
ncbi:MAG: ABC transporter permease [Chloroflexota bacterium]